MKKIIIIGLILLSIGFITNNISVDEINTGRFNNIAIRGYDSVAYHLLAEAQKGSADFSLKWNGAEWHFTSEKYRELFESDPEKYAPQFGGFCANGLSDGHKIRANPKNWRIYEGKLFLFYSGSGRDSWDVDIDEQIQLANEYWKKVQYK
jgi:YHS domain-containing protein